MIPNSFVVGAPLAPGTYKIRDGRKAVVLCSDAPGSWPIKGYVVHDSDGSTARGWSRTGTVDSNPLQQNDHDLIGPWAEPKPPLTVTKDLWLMLWSDGAIITTDREPLRGRSGALEIIAIRRMRVTMTEGEFE
jgi:hypothetical protein